MINQTRLPVLNMMVYAVLAMAVCGCDKSEGIVSREDSAADTLSSVTAEVIDLELAHAVKVALMKEPSLVDADIVVVASNGEVRLTGVVDNQEQHDLAMNVATGVTGIRVVSDKLEVKEQN